MKSDTGMLGGHTFWLNVQSVGDYTIALPRLGLRAPSQMF